MTRYYIERYVKFQVRADSPAAADTKVDDLGGEPLNDGVTLWTIQHDVKIIDRSWAILALFLASFGSIAASQVQLGHVLLALALGIGLGRWIR